MITLPALAYNVEYSISLPLLQYYCCCTNTNHTTTTTLSTKKYPCCYSLIKLLVPRAIIFGRTYFEVQISTGPQNQTTCNATGIGYNNEI